MNSVLLSSPLFMILYGLSVLFALLSILIKKGKTIFTLSSALSYIFTTAFALISSISVMECMIVLLIILIIMISPLLKGDRKDVL